LKRNGVHLKNNSWFDTLEVQVLDAQHVSSLASAQKICFRLIDQHHVGISLDESTTKDDVFRILQIFNCPDESLLWDQGYEQVQHVIPPCLQREEPFLTHPTFNQYHAEHEMLRYIRRLSDKDLALDRTMIPLGSCTMKLNATSEMLPISWPNINQIHPFAPPEHWRGYAVLIEQLEKMLCAATGYSAVSLQPNAGSQGEYAGLLVIRAYHASRNESHRKICLIPSSAHGTNPASAQMAGMDVVVVGCDLNGNVDMEDLRIKAEQYSETLAAIMITYPSTHGVFESTVSHICNLIHLHGGQVYIDGANMNALVGTASPGHFGGDVSHLNLHKTFCIPHGGGGPGVGPVAVRTHLAEFLPFSYTAKTVDFQRTDLPRISSAPFGSASILPISWMYIAMMGAHGLKTATEVAILSANYLAKKLSSFYPILYTGQNGLVAHECILDIRPIQKSSGITNEDIAKRLIDYGFHAPTMSFPVPGTLMLEPTESESKAELDRFIEAMVSIREEIDKVISGEFDAMDNPLKNAPHTSRMLSSDIWKHSYSRQVAGFPVSRLHQNKYWPPVSRIDNVFGDRNLFCACIPVDEYALSKESV
jgi:glycine dehydrogenase